jgi:DNA invertase Pin-like site-specific DNA recombinase
MRFVTPVDDGGAPVGQRAAQYVRMSTDMQIYSAENQAAAIAAYAASRGLHIVSTYLDEDRSGIIIDNRDGLQRLLADVESGTADFQFVLVYDVSRWGRFQDPDESAFYEFICKRAGIKVAYCAELFENDGSLLSTMMKNVKRVMAGELSRDKSAIISAGACRVARQGFKQGGTAGFGLQRVLVDQHGNPRCPLHKGDRKYFNSDRVILQPGKPEEVETVRRVFRSFVVAGKSELTIARELNEEGIFNEFGRPWRMLAVRRLLTCEKYIGSYVYNRKSGKLKRRRKPNPPERWIRCDEAFEAVVDPTIFERARKIFAKRPARMTHLWPSDEDMLARLKGLWLAKGKVTDQIIDNADDDMPCSATYSARFGSLAQAYALIGYKPRPRSTFSARRAAIATIGKLEEELASAIQRTGVCAEFVRPTTHRSSAVLTVNKVLSISIYLARSTRLPNGGPRWEVRRRIAYDSDLILIARMNESNQGVLDHFLLSPDRIIDGKISLWGRSRDRLKAHCFRDISDLIAPIWQALSHKMKWVPTIICRSHSGAANSSHGSKQSCGAARRLQARQRPAAGPSDTSLIDGHLIPARANCFALMVSPSR